jgi:steroid delta-isomerase-like uncharacterized protein
MPGNQNPAMPASRHRGVTLAAMPPARMCAMLRRDQEAPLRPKPEVQVMTQEASKQYLPRERVVQDNLALMRRYFDLLYTRDLDALLELVDDDIEWLVVPTGDVIRGKASLAELAANHWGASPDRTKRLLNLFATEDYACMEYTSGGTLTGEVDFRSIKIAPSGRTYEIRCCFVFHFRNGRIDRVHEYFDMDTVKRLTSSAAAADQRAS